jgi:putative membrane-bound dehydrogenase-like protein
MNHFPLIRFIIGASLLATSLSSRSEAAEGAPAEYRAGVAQIDITPKHPIRLNGFGFRRTESEGVTQRIRAKALALDDGSKDPALLITVDLLGIPIDIRDELAQRFEKKAGLKNDHLAITATHTHTAPMLKGANPTLFGVPIPKEHLEHIDSYTAEFLDKLEQVGLEALNDMKPAKLSWGIGKVGFAINRRTRGGPTDHDLPVLFVRDLRGKLRAVYTSYACHCVTLSNNKISGDWAGFAQEAIQDAFPGAVALMSVGCGADQNPSSGVTGDKVEVATLQGKEVADEVKRLAAGYLRPITGKITAAVETIELPLAPLPTREQWEEKAKRKDAVGHHARVQLEKLDGGEKLRTKIEYPIQSWRFGDSLAMVFLPGEVVVDYSLRLKRELDGLRLWMNAYANDAPCYIPSERVLKEGGYEGGGAMIYYDVPVPFAPGLEEPIVHTIHKQIEKDVPAPYDPEKVQGTRPLPPQRSRGEIRTKPHIAVDLIAAEPLVNSPVAIDFGPDGKLWVAEMVDYPQGKSGKFEPGGRIRVLENSAGDGVFDKATVFLDNIPFPTGVTVWRKGVLVCAAPDILYAEDTDGDGKADVVKKLFSGFGTHNYQARVNSLQYGLDGWVYGSCGLFGGTIRSFTGKELTLGDRDFRIKPDTGDIEPATGRTQQGRVRNDWGDWFGCDNSTLLRHYALEDHYLRRNPNATSPDAAVYVPDYLNSKRLYPIKSDAQRFKLSGPAGLVTAACGLGIYRDERLGKEFTGDAFVCEPVNLIVHRLKLSPKDSTFSGKRADDEKESEFLATTDNWSRFVQATTGPDGGLWVVDMYRFVIEHPRWIPPEDLKQLDVRAGAGMGRIYRVRPKDEPSRSLPRLDRLDTAGLVAALDSANGWQRDMAMQMLVWNADKAAVRLLEKLARESKRPEARVQALCALDGLKAVSPKLLKAALGDEHPGVRRHAVRLSEQHINTSDLDLIVAKLAFDSDAQVQLQVAYTLGELRGPASAPMLEWLARHHPDDPFLTAAVLSSVKRDNVVVLLGGLCGPWAKKQLAPPHLVRQVFGIAASMRDEQMLSVILTKLLKPEEGKYTLWQIAAAVGVLETIEGQGRTLDKLPEEQRSIIEPLLTEARRQVADESASEDTRLAAMPLLGREPARRKEDIFTLGKLLSPATPPAVQSATVNILARSGDEQVPALLVTSWKGHSPALKGQVLDALLSRPPWRVKLLNALGKKELPAAEIDTARRQRLLMDEDESIRSAASKVFNGAASPDRHKVLRDYGAVLTMMGDRERGKAVFAKSCAPCHQLEAIGHVVGPDLAALANRTPAYLLSEILDPNRNVDSRYVEYQARTASGRTITGLLAGETATTVILRWQEGKQETILRGDLEELRSSGKSLMPEGLEKDIALQAMSDLLAYLTSTAAPPKKVAGNNPTLVKASAGRLTLRAADCEIHGGQITFEQQFENIGMWHGTADHVVWCVQLEKTASFDVYLTYACADDSAGNTYVLEAGKQAIRGKVASTKGWDHYQRVKIGTLKLGAGVTSVTLRPDGPLKGALLDLRTLYLVPEGADPNSKQN